MTYNDLASKFYCTYADGAGVICEAPIGLYEEPVHLSVKLRFRLSIQFSSIGFISGV